MCTHLPGDYPNIISQMKTKNINYCSRIGGKAFLPLQAREKYNLSEDYNHTTSV